MENFYFGFRDYLCLWVLAAKTKNGCLKSGTGNGYGFPHLLQPCFIRQMKYRVETYKVILFCSQNGLHFLLHF